MSSSTFARPSRRPTRCRPSPLRPGRCSPRAPRLRIPAMPKAEAARQRPDLRGPKQRRAPRCRRRRCCRRGTRARCPRARAPRTPRCARALSRNLLPARAGAAVWAWLPPPSRDSKPHAERPDDEPPASEPDEPLETAAWPAIGSRCGRSGHMRFGRRAPAQVRFRSVGLLPLWHGACFSGPATPQREGADDMDATARFIRAMATERTYRREPAQGCHPTAPSAATPPAPGPRITPPRRAGLSAILGVAAVAFVTVALPVAFVTDTLTPPPVAASAPNTVSMAPAAADCSCAS